MIGLGSQRLLKDLHQEVIPVSGVYIFPSKSERNILIGIKAGLWAIPIQKNKPSIVGKARSMAIGDRMLLYLNGQKLLYGIFRVTELPDHNRVVSGVWVGKFELPFRFALSDSQSKVGIVFAPSLMKILPSLRNAGGTWKDHITKFRGMTVFQKQALSNRDIAALAAEFSRAGSEGHAPNGTAG